MSNLPLGNFPPLTVPRPRAVRSQCIKISLLWAASRLLFRGILDSFGTDGPQMNPLRQFLFLPEAPFPFAFSPVYCSSWHRSCPLMIYP